MLKAFITGGGTGGHIYPAIAIADAISEEPEDKYGFENQIYYIGNPSNLEYAIVKEKNYKKFLPVLCTGMPREMNKDFLKWACRLFVAWKKCREYIRKYNPQVIFGTGGYVTAPVILAGITMGVPIVMHDCDANPGLVTRKLSPFAKIVSIAFESAKLQIKNRNCYLNGNPIRKAFSTTTKDEARKKLNIEDKLTLCIMGGSQGAKSINNAGLQIIKELSQKYNLQIIFQTGKKKYDQTIEQLQVCYPEYEQDKNIIIKPYFNNMATVLKASDIAVSRAGSLSISELCACSIAAIFIPYPYAAADHQRKNARYMEERGAGLYLEDSDDMKDSMLELITDLINNPDKLRSIQENAGKLAKFDAVEKLVEQIKKVSK